MSVQIWPAPLEKKIKEKKMTHNYDSLLRSMKEAEERVDISETEKLILQYGNFMRYIDHQTMSIGIDHEMEELFEEYTLAFEKHIKMDTWDKKSTEKINKFWDKNGSIIRMLIPNKKNK